MRTVAHFTRVSDGSAVVILDLIPKTSYPVILTGKCVYENTVMAIMKILAANNIFCYLLWIRICAKYVAYWVSSYFAAYYWHHLNDTET